MLSLSSLFHPLRCSIHALQVFRKNKLSVDMVATSEVSVSLSLDPKKIRMGDGESSLGQQLDHLVFEMEKIAEVTYRHGKQ